MHEILLMGRILPERRSISISDIGAFSYSDPRGFDAKFSMTIKNSIISIRCEIVEESKNYLNMCIVRAYEHVTSLVDLYAFTKGWSLSVIIDEMIQNGKRQGVALSEFNGVEYCTTISDETDLIEVWNLVLSNFNLKFALRDLILSISTLNYSAIAAARAIETIRDLIAPVEASDKVAWEILRDKLLIDRSFIQYVTDKSRKPRHGDRGATSGEVQLEVTKRAWIIMDRYIEFLKRGGNEKLPKHEYSTLA